MCMNLINVFVQHSGIVCYFLFILILLLCKHNYYICLSGNFFKVVVRLTWVVKGVAA